MPCYPYPEESAAEQRKALLKQEAISCALMKALLSLDGMTVANVTKIVNWVAAGVTKNEFLKWWVDHVAQDKARSEKETRALEEKRIKAKALSKLTKDEQRLLGLLK